MKRLLSDTIYIYAIDCDGATASFIETGKKRDGGGLSSSTLTYKSYLLSSRYMEVKVIDYDFFLSIAITE